MFNYHNFHIFVNKTFTYFMEKIEKYKLLYNQIKSLIQNENDTIATEEIKVGDNDTLSAMVAASVGANCLVLLSDIDGLYTADPHKCADAKLIHNVDELTPEIMALAGDAGSSLGTGGMKTKLHAAELCRDAGCEMVILNGAEPNLLYDLFEGKEVGTRFFANGE